MNKVFLTGNLTGNPETRYTQEPQPKAYCRFRIAVPKRFQAQGQPTADFINCVAFGKAAEFIDKYFQKGSRIIVVGRLQTGSYTNQEGVKVNTCDVVIEEVEFGSSKNESSQQDKATQRPPMQTSAPQYTNQPVSAASHSQAAPTGGFIPAGYTPTQPVMHPQNSVPHSSASQASVPQPPVQQSMPTLDEHGFMNIPDGIDEELPFN